MSILEVIKNRRSIRKFQKKEIPKEIIDKMIEALIWAPSAGNLQSRKFYFVFNEKTKRELAETSQGQGSFIANAPLVIVGCSDEEKIEYYGERGKNLYSICDVSVSIQNLMLFCHEQGLGTVWIGAFDEKKVVKILNLPKKLKPIVIVPVGYPALKPKPPLRVSKNQAVEFIK